LYLSRRGQTTSDECCVCNAVAHTRNVRVRCAQRVLIYDAVVITLSRSYSVRNGPTSVVNLVRYDGGCAQACVPELDFCVLRTVVVWSIVANNNV